MYDLILRGGTVIDPSQGWRDARDVAVEGGKIVAVESSMPGDAQRVIDVSGKLVTPGLIDLHAHVFDSVASNGLDPDLAGVRAGVTTVVDAGSSGSATFAAFPRHILPRAQTEVIPFLHICQTGLATNPDIIAAASIDLDATLQVAYLQVVDPRHHGPYGVASPRDPGHGNAPSGKARGAREWTAADGPHWRHTEAIRPQRHSRVVATTGRRRHRYASLHSQSGRCARRWRQIGTRSPRAGGARRLAGHGPWPIELRL